MLLFVKRLDACTSILVLTKLGLVLLAVELRLRIPRDFAFEDIY